MHTDRAASSSRTRVARDLRRAALWVRKVLIDMPAQAVGADVNQKVDIRSNHLLELLYA